MTKSEFVKAVRKLQSFNKDIYSLERALGCDIDLSSGFIWEMLNFCGDLIINSVTSSVEPTDEQYNEFWNSIIYDSVDDEDIENFYESIFN